MLESLQIIIDFLTSGVYDFLVQLVSWLVQGVSYLYLQFQIAAIKLSWDVGSQMLQDLNISNYMSQALGYLDSKTLNVVYFFKVPEFLNTITSAYATRYVMSVIGI